METLLEILSELHPDVDFAKEEQLVERGILGSFDVVMLVTRIEEEFDVVIPARLITPETFRSAATLYETIEQLAEED
ncbi:MAG: acyl carrier protein [Clostridia bacterium]|jgi:acyl carrier protein|nr:acyl carrier protein [Clostridia bacterium]